MKIVIDIQYFPAVTLFSKLSGYTHCIFEQYELFEKMSFRNRCVIYGANGPINLTVPLSGGRNQRTVMKNVRVLNTTNWQANHWKSITSAYNKSPWFEHFRYELEHLYRKRFEFLVDWNLECFRWASAIVSPHIGYSLTESFIPQYDPHSYDDWRGRLKPATINRIFTSPDVYTQVFQDRSGFIPNLSILDYLFCAGPRLRGL